MSLTTIRLKRGPGCHLYTGAYRYVAYKVPDMGYRINVNKLDGTFTGYLFMDTLEHVKLYIRKHEAGEVLV